VSPRRSQEGVDSSKVCEILKEKLKIPIILIVNRIAAGEKAGCKTDEFINKPIDKNLLSQLVKKLLGYNAKLLLLLWHCCG
jgi:hypothetical protein